MVYTGLDEGGVAGRAAILHERVDARRAGYSDGTDRIQVDPASGQPNCLATAPCIQE